MTERIRQEDIHEKRRKVYFGYMPVLYNFCVFVWNCNQATDIKRSDFSN